MKRALPFIIEGTPEEKQRIERILREIATTDSGYALLYDGTLEKGRRCTIQINDDRFKDKPDIVGMHVTTPDGCQSIFLRSNSTDSDLFRTVVHEVGHQYDALAGIRSLERDPLEDVIGRKFTEASSFGIEAQICWEQEHKGSSAPRVPGPPITAWTAYKKAKPYSAERFEELCRKSVSAVESGEAMAAVAKRTLDNPDYGKDLEIEEIGWHERSLARKSVPEKPPERKFGEEKIKAEQKKRMASLRKNLKAPFIFKNMDRNVREKLESRLRKEARLVHEGSAGWLDTVLARKGLPPSGMKESESSDEAVQALAAWKKKHAPGTLKYGEVEEFLDDFYDRRFLAQNGEASRQDAASGNEKVMMPKALGSPEHKERITRILAEIASTPKGHALLHGRPAGEEACNIAFDDALCGSHYIPGFYANAQDIVVLDSRMDDASLFVTLADGLLRERHGKDGIPPDPKGDPGEKMAIWKVLEADVCTDTAQIAWQYHKAAHENPLPVWEEMQYARPEVAQVFESACGRSEDASIPPDAGARAFCGILSESLRRMAAVEDNVLYCESLKLPSRQGSGTGGMEDVLGRLDVMSGISPEARQMVVQAANAEKKRVHEPNLGHFTEVCSMRSMSARGMEVVKMPKTGLEWVKAEIAAAFNSAARRLEDFLEGRPGQDSTMKRKGTVKCP